MKQDIRLPLTGFGGYAGGTPTITTFLLCSFRMSQMVFSLMEWELASQMSL